MRQVNAIVSIGAGMLQVPLIMEAQKLGLYVIATDGDAKAAGVSIAEEFRQVDTYDIAAHQRLAAELHTASDVTILGCCTAGADVAPTVAAVCAVLGTPGIPLVVAQRTHNKLAVRKRLHAVGCSHYQPGWAALGSMELVADEWDMQSAWEYGHVLGYPVVIKPLTQCASRGITLVDDPTQMLGACTKAVAYEGGMPILIEQHLVGTEHSAEMILDGYGDVVWFNVVDRPFDYSRGVPIELGHINPTALPPSTVTAIREMLLDAARALGVTWGPFKVDVILTADGPKILECTARLSGGWDSQGTSPLTGRHPMRTLLQLACNLPMETWPATTGYAACAAILPQRCGLLKALPSGLALHPGMPPFGTISQVIWAFRPGERAGPIEHNAQRAGFVLATAPTYDAAWLTAKGAADVLAASVNTPP